MAENRSNRRQNATKNKGGVDVKRIAVITVAFVVVFYFIYVLISQQISINQKSKEIETLKQQVITATEESEILKQEIENLNDPEYLERIAREQLGLVRPNERVFVDSNKSEDNK